MIRGAAAGDAQQRQMFAQRYAEPIATYLRARWRSSPMLQEVDDAVQEVFVECCRDGGALERASASKTSSGGFRGYLYGVARNIALRFEQRRGRLRERQPPEGLITHGLIEDEERLSRTFDRAWAAGIMREAAQRHAETAAGAGEAAQRRVDLLRLRFGEGLPIRDIAARWDVPAESLHREYARAREEFREALRDVIAFHAPGSAAGIDTEAGLLLASLGGD
jgi:RNA polymerase sigma-70 factor (ECF subfamily)